MPALLNLYIKSENFALLEEVFNKKLKFLKIFEKKKTKLTCNILNFVHCSCSIYQLMGISNYCWLAATSLSLRNFCPVHAKMFYSVIR